MKEKTFSLVTTTINVPRLLEAYAKDAREHSRKIENFIIVGDRKTPKEVKDFCEKIQKEIGISCIYLAPENQDRYLARWPKFKEFLPWNCIQRRNVGLLYAYFEGSADIIITIDDDNLLSEKDYFGCHRHVGEEKEISVMHAESGWWNVCEMLEEARGIPFYHRGHPFSQRWKENGKPVIKRKRGRVMVNAGLWLDDPDVDALTRLYFPVRAVRPSPLFKATLGLDTGTWAPFNSQNTALAREVIPAYFLFPYIGRYDDIWASFIIRHIADFLGDFVTYGAPLVVQKRNPHDYFKDFDAERFGMEYNDVFLRALRACRLAARSYGGAFAEISEQLPAILRKTCKNEGKTAVVFDEVLEGFTLWSDIFRV